MNGKIQCLVCGEILESKYTHNYVQCHCDNEATVDGGHEYTRILAKDLKKVKVIQSVDGDIFGWNWGLKYFS